MLIKLNDGCSVDPAWIAQVTANYGSQSIRVLMKDGISHNLGATEGLSLKDTYVKLLEQINRELMHP